MQLGLFQPVKIDAVKDNVKKFADLFQYAEREVTNVGLEEIVTAQIDEPH